MSQMKQHRGHLYQISVTRLHFHQENFTAAKYLYLLGCAWQPSFDYNIKFVSIKRA